MKRITATLFIVLAGVVAGVSTADARDKLTVGYFLEWPMPFQYAKANGTYDKELGLKINRVQPCRPPWRLAMSISRSARAFRR